MHENIMHGPHLEEVVVASVVTGTATVVTGTATVVVLTVVTGHTRIGQPLRQPHSLIVTLDLLYSHPVGGGVHENIGHGLHL